MPIDDPDMELIQGLFICSKEWHRQRNIERLVYGASACMALTVMVLYLMVSK
jgi:predicted nucleic acid-binding Zn ribbon protein